ncbi:ectoine/hydroxyectoine ABC transporter permease subunit EhuD [Nocardia cyriacigeorgica]|uniref:Putative amino-acid ABC transporter permease protein y4tG n=1 Tax=Nocardia cyriacigeorgica (strain GUH-2) TaxID=1127134 RepID=H6R4T0_NOCCG|nr:ectoine/hydroxyectoine ABC transporter permease subunit EhuD [Nocardia cyriacigeorgica]MBF6284864.1 ectoine/hydroxyectoine ABC transporter permease subunit EhuD [Nocardia cyriacigeorgica]MBF6423811.1 ectoine/hydroxyectoine ABC transporter permease subunit EhuD [Nocardia cyriacigeorgica]BDT88215.1 ectoine/hydroxyectoine ABC transporter permease subunit EhuD [Nocardia cyriacigeorgica]CCF64555.1 putative amino-acid ABC transporter permease protein y4tG [Nocardia cyriacigeorgica GUH-2]
MTVEWSWERARESLPVLWDGFEITLLATVIGFAIAAVIGLAIAIVRQSCPRWVAAPVHAVAEFIRLTPLVVQLLFAYNLLPQFSALQIGITVLGIHYSSYLAEVYRAGIEAVPAGQWEAARALSLPPYRTWRAVVLPQAIRASVPALGTNAVSMFKDTPFLFAISVVELVTAAQQFGARNFQYLEPLTLAGVFFLIASYPTSVLIRRLEKRLAYY